MKFIYSDHFNKYVTPIEHWSVLPAQPIVSVIVSTYNHENYIQQCLDGILMQQTTFDYEIILKEDCSTDNTREIVKQYQKKYPDKIRLWLTNENLYSKKIKLGGYDYIDSKYIARCEGDDYWTDSLKLQKQVDILDKDESLSLCCHSYSVITEKGIINTKPGEHSKNEILKSKTLITLADYINQKSIKTLTVICRAKYFKIYDFEKNYIKKEKSMAGDILLFFKLLSIGNCYVINEKMGIYRIHAGGISQKNESKYLRATLIVLLNTINFAMDNKLPKKNIQLLFNKITSLMLTSIRQFKNLDLFKYYIWTLIKKNTK